MIYYLTLFAVLFGFVAPSIAEDKPMEDERLTLISSCSGIMSAEELLVESEKLMQMDNDDKDFFATNCLILGAHKNNAEAQYKLAEAYEQGIGVPHSDVYAYKWLKIAILNGKEVDKDRLARIERNMNITDFEIANNEVSNHIAFEKKLEATRGNSDLKSILKDFNADVSPDQLKRIEATQKEIEALFNSSGLKNKDLKETGYSSFNRQSSIQTEQREMEIMEEDRLREEMYSQRIEREQNIRANENMMQMQDQLPTRSKSEEKNKKTSSPPKIDFYTDKYNPQFSPPPSM